MLLKLREYMRKEKIVSTQQLMREFSLDVQALLPMLQCWIRKGVISPCEKKQSCQSACLKGCDQELVVYYEYIG